MGKNMKDTLKFLIGFETEEDDDFDGYPSDLYADVKKDQGPQNSQSKQETRFSSIPDNENHMFTPKDDSIDVIQTSNKVLNIHSNARMNVVLFDPKSFEDSIIIVDTLKTRKPVILNISEAEVNLGRKIFDFCSGALYALDGHIEQISKGIFILAPNNVEVSGDLKNSMSDTISGWAERKK